MMPTNLADGEEPRYLQLISGARVDCRLTDLIAALERNRDDLRKQPS
jgi:hypothetical protein